MLVAFATLIRLAWAVDAGEGCEGGICQESVASGSLLQFNSHVGRGTKEEKTCSAVHFEDNGGHVNASGCASLRAGESCKVTCASGFVGTPAKYFCFSQQAEVGGPPVSVRPPLCRPKDKQLFPDKERLPLAINGEGCLRCTRANGHCEVVADPTGPSDERCTRFYRDSARNLVQVPEVRSQCLDNFGSGRLGLWGCHGGGNQLFKPEEPIFGTSGRLATRSHRGVLLLYRVGEVIYEEGGVEPPLSSILPAVDSLKAGKTEDFFTKIYAVQHCKAKLEADVPDNFWSWLEGQKQGMKGSLFSTFPVVPNQVKLLADLLNLKGKEVFQDEGVKSFAIALAHVNRHQQIDEEALTSHDSYNGYPYLAGQEEQAREANRRGEWVGVSSNECGWLPRCCGNWTTWKFKYPRTPPPTVGQWFSWWLDTVDKKKDKLWNNPLTTPWVFNTYLWPSSLEDCEWVHKKLIDGEPMEGRWYLYDSSFHKRVCDGGKYFPNEIPGIAVYGGVCGRLAELEWRKTSCMGMPAHQKNEPGHCAGFKFTSATGIQTTLTHVSGIPGWPENTCLKCDRGGYRCESRPIGSSECTSFVWDGKQMRAPTGRCLDVFSGPYLGTWTCNGGRDQLMKLLDENTLQIYQSSRAQPIFRTTNGKPVPTTPSTKWSYSAFHTVSCAKWNCHYRNALHLDSANGVPQYTHTEGAVALATAVGEYEQDGIWPTAYNEARLAASVGWVLLHKYQGVDKSKIEALILWALKRNPSLYEAWHLAAELPSEHTSQELKDLLANDYEKQPFRHYYNSLGLFSHHADTARTEYHREFANRLVKEHITSDKMKDHWNKHPALLLRVVGKVCGLLDDDVVEQLDPMENSCGLMKRLVQGSDEVWTGLKEQMVNGSIDEKITNAGNDDFEQGFHLLAFLVMTNQQPERTEKLIRELLDSIAVGYIDKRTQTFFAEHGRVLLRGPYAGILQLAGITLPKSERQNLMEHVKNMLQNPVDNWDRMVSALGTDETMMVVAWMAETHVHRKIEEETTVGDSVDGFKPDEQANQNVMDEMKQDRAVDLERGYHIWEQSNTEEEDRFNIQHILETLLNVNVEDLPESSNDLDGEELGTIEGIDGNITTLIERQLMKNARRAQSAQAQVAFESCIHDYAHQK